MSPNDVAADAADRALSVAQSSFPSQFSGITLAPDGSYITVYATQLSPPIEQSVSAAAAPIPVHYEVVPLSQLALDSLNQKIASAHQALASAGINVESSVPNFVNGVVDITVDNLTPTITNSLLAQFGQDLNVSSADSSNKIYFQDRTNDSSPWAGGDYLVLNKTNSTTANYCTSGLSIVIGGTSHIMTAGHCSHGESGSNWTMYNSNSVGTSLQRMGTLQTDKLNGSDELDVSTATAKGYAGFWTGPPGSPQLTPVHDRGSNFNNEHICISGAPSGSLCDFVVNNVNGCYNISYMGSSNSQMVCGLTKADVSNNATIGGDSGAPVYRTSDDDYILGIGMLSAYGNNEEYFTGLDTILSSYNATYCSLQSC